MTKQNDIKIHINPMKLAEVREIQAKVDSMLGEIFDGRRKEKSRASESEELIRVKSKKLCLANGDEFTDTEFSIPQDVWINFISVKVGTKTIKVNPDFILSFEQN